jgi:hypothetical protein
VAIDTLFFISDSVYSPFSCPFPNNPRGNSKLFGNFSCTVGSIIDFLNNISIKFYKESAFFPFSSKIYFISRFKTPVRFSFCISINKLCSSVVFPAHNLKIFNPVIIFFPVLMMDKLFWFQISTKMLFHNKSMFHNITTFFHWMIGRVNHHISSLIFPFPCFKISFSQTSIRTIIASIFDVANTPNKRLPTLFTPDFHYRHITHYIMKG